MNSSTDPWRASPRRYDQAASLHAGHRPLRLLHVVSHASGGGAETQLGYLAAAQARLGYEVHVAFLHVGPAGPPRDTGGAAWHHLGPAGNHDPRLLFRLRRLVRRIRPDVVQTWTPQMDILVGIVSAVTRLRWILRDGSYGPTETRRWKTWLRCRLARRAIAVVANSRAGQAYWTRWCGATACRFVPNAVPLDRIPAQAGGIDTAGDVEDSVAAFMRGGSCILYAGRLDPEKNLTTLLDAVSFVRQAHPVQLLICGSGSQGADLERRARMANLENAIQFAGHVPHERVWAYMRQAALFVNISRFEGCPNAVLEAMACRCPIVVSDIPAHREFLDETTAVFVDGASARSVAEGIQRILADPEAARRRVEAARRAVADYSVESTTRMYEDIYHEPPVESSRLPGSTGSPAGKAGA